MGSLCCVAAKSDRSDSASRDFSFGPHEPYWRTNTSFSPPSSRWDVPGVSLYGSSTSSNANLLPSPDLSQTLHCSFSSCSDDIGDSETNRNFSNRRFFLSKPVHPIHHSGNAREMTSDSADACSWSSGTTTSSIDSTEAVVDWDNHNSTKPQRAVSSIFRCGLCNRYISQKSPCGSRSIVNMPVTGVLPCQHVFHAECLERSTPMAQRSDPPCPICIEQKGEQQSKSHSIVPRLKPFCEDGPSTTRQWACAQVGDCVESAVNVPPRNTMVMINRNRMRKNLPLRGSSSKVSPRKMKKSSSFMENFADQVSLVHSSRGKEKI